MIENVANGVVWSENQVSIDITKAQSDELRAALSLIDKYKKIAIKEYRGKYKFNPERESDWCEFGYSVKNDKVLVLIRSGMAG
jgi:hypothetical protein